MLCAFKIIQISRLTFVCGADYIYMYRFVTPKRSRREEGRKKQQQQQQQQQQQKQQQQLLLLTDIDVNQTKKKGGDGDAREKRTARSSRF